LVEEVGANPVDPGLISSTTPWVGGSMATPSCLPAWVTLWCRGARSPRKFSAGVSPRVGGAS